MDDCMKIIWVKCLMSHKKVVRIFIAYWIGLFVTMLQNYLPPSGLIHSSWHYLCWVCNDFMVCIWQDMVTYFNFPSHSLIRFEFTVFGHTCASCAGGLLYATFCPTVCLLFQEYTGVLCASGTVLSTRTFQIAYSGINESICNSHVACVSLKVGSKSQSYKAETHVHLKI